MTSPSSPLQKTNLPNTRFPRTREEAEAVTAQIEVHLRAQGCRCARVKVEFVTPRAKREKPYIYVEHEPLCLLAYGPTSS